MHTFKRCEHLKKSADFAAVFKSGRRRSVYGAVLYYLPNSLPHHRIGFAMRRGYGNAVERNRCKRLSREAWRLLPKDGGVHYDFVLSVRSKGGTLAFRQRQLLSLTRGLV